MTETILFKVFERTNIKGNLGMDSKDHKIETWEIEQKGKGKIWDPSPRMRGAVPARQECASVT